MTELFEALISRRLPSSTFYAELHLLPGPVAVAEIGNGTQRERFGRNWLVLIDRERIPLAYQEQPAGSGEWLPVTANLPPVFGVPLPEGVRRLTAVFDQSGRLLIAYEHEGLVRVTRWDPPEGQYIQNVTFPGINPALTIDLLAGIPAGDSDVQLYYQPADDLTRIMCRVQRELYLTEHQVYEHSEPLILDRAQINNLQLQLLVSDAAGAPLRNSAGQVVGLVSGYYPRYAEDHVLFAAKPTLGIYEEAALIRGIEDSVVFDLAPTPGRYEGLIAEYALAADPVVFDLTPIPGRYESHRSTHTTRDAVAFGIQPIGGAYEAFIAANPQAQDTVAFQVTPTVGRYQEV